MRTIGVGMGIRELPFRDGAGFWHWVDLCEAGGIDSLWQSDRIISREPVLETMTVMAALAACTMPGIKSRARRRPRRRIRSVSICSTISRTT